MNERPERFDTSSAMIVQSLMLAGKIVITAGAVTRTIWIASAATEVVCALSVAWASSAWLAQKSSAKTRRRQTLCPRL